MNILDLAFNYTIDIDFDGDIDGGNYHITMNYLLSTQQGVEETETKISLKQWDIDELYLGAKKLVKLLEKHATEGY